MSNVLPRLLGVLTAEPPPTTTLPIVVPQSPPTIEQQIALVKEAHAETLRGMSHTAAHSIRTGEYLLTLKAMLKQHRSHGAWEDIVTIECRLTMRTAQVYMHLARHKDQLQQLISARARNSAVLTQAEMLKFLSMAGKKKRR